MEIRFRLCLTLAFIVLTTGSKLPVPPAVLQSVGSSTHPPASHHMDKQSNPAPIDEETSLGMSLHELSVRNPWFATHPLQWTERHLQLVNCTFQQLDAPSETGRYQRDTLFDVEMFATEWNSGLKGWFFASFSIAMEVPWNILTLLPSETSRARLIVGFYEYAWAVARRRRKLYPWNHPAGKEAAHRLHERRLRQFTPETWTQDPYLVCIMLSLAQDEWYRGRRQSYPVCLVVCSDTDKANAYIYHAEFPVDIMDGLKNPSLRIATWPTIDYTTVTIKPHGTFLDRLTTTISKTKEGKTSTAESLKEHKPRDGTSYTEMAGKIVKPDTVKT